MYEKNGENRFLCGFHRLFFDLMVRKSIFQQVLQLCTGAI